MSRLWSELPRPASEALSCRTLFNSRETVPRRLYGSLGPSLLALHLAVPLEALLQRTSLYLRDGPGARCLSALDQLRELQRCGRMVDATRAAMFPASSAVQHIDRDFGVVPDTPVLAAAPSFAEAMASTLSPGQARRPSRRRSSVGQLPASAQFAPRPMSAGAVASPMPVDFIERNKRATLDASLSNSLRPRPPVFVQAAGPVYHYSSQTLNSTQTLREQMEMQLRTRLEPFATYNPAFHHSGTMHLLPALNTTADRLRPGGFDLYRQPTLTRDAPTLRQSEVFDTHAKPVLFPWDTVR